ncbi:MAG: hypothetical protein HYR73_09225 [Candidatus Eisenbacteria bacterium]|nr:hypothetical protein [Candidatus Eisenbacteria bacterium]
MSAAIAPARRKRRAPRADPHPAGAPKTPGALPALPPEWRAFVGHWLASAGCTVGDAARGDWEVELSPALKRRWRRQRVRLVFDPQRATLPRGAWFTAPGSGAGRRVLEAALEHPMITRRTALAHVPGAPDDGLVSACKVRGLTWGPPRLGPVRYERRVAFHAVVTRWGGLPLQESWVALIEDGGRCIETAQGTMLPDVRPREGLYQIPEALDDDGRERWMGWARAALDALLAERERDWERNTARLRDDELERLGAFYSARIEEEEERLRRRASHPEDPDLAHGDATSLKLEWERRAAEVRQRWAIRTEVRLWGLEEWSWPVADLVQELRSGAVRVRISSKVDVARGRPALPGCPGCGTPAEMLVRSRGTVVCARCA